MAVRWNWVRVSMRVVSPAMPMLPPSWRVRLYRPEALEMSFFGTAPSAARLSGRNIITVPSERKMSGQKKSSAPVCSVITFR